jgi:uncharacterized membrane protein YukC
MEQPMLDLPLSQWLFMLGIGLLVIEIAFLGFATFVLFFCRPCNACDWGIDGCRNSASDNQ